MLGAMKWKTPDGKKLRPTQNRWAEEEIAWALSHSIANTAKEWGRTEYAVLQKLWKIHRGARKMLEN